MRFTGKVALVTGAGQGLGRAMALALAKDGAAVAVNDIGARGADETVKAIGDLDRRGCAVLADVSDRAAVGAMVDRVEADLGPIDILINNAGIGDFVSWPEITAEKWQKMLDVHLAGTFNCCQAVLPGMIGRGAGKILNVSSVAGKRGDYLGNAHYTAANAGIIGLTRSLAGDVAAKGVNVNGIAPGLVETALTERMSGDLRQTTVGRIPVGRLARAEEIAAAAAFMVSDDASYVVGETMSVNGGSYMD